MTDESPKTMVLKDRAVLLLISGMSVSAAETFCVQQGADLDAARRIVAEARKRITVAADYARDEQFGRAIMRLEDLYAKSIAAQDTRTALQAQRELNRLLGLYSPREASADEPGDAAALHRRLELIAGYLIPLRLADPQYPVEEHVRIAADLIRTHELAGAVPAA